MKEQTKDFLLIFLAIFLIIALMFTEGCNKEEIIIEKHKVETKIKNNEMEIEKNKNESLKESIEIDTLLSRIDYYKKQVSTLEHRRQNDTLKINGKRIKQTRLEKYQDTVIKIQDTTIERLTKIRRLNARSIYLLEDSNKLRELKIKTNKKNNNKNILLGSFIGFVSGVIVSVLTIILTN